MSKDLKSVQDDLAFLRGLAEGSQERGGLGVAGGALYGAVCLQGIFLVVGKSAGALHTRNTPLVYGVVLILFLVLFPNGIAGLLRSAQAWWQRWRGGR